MVLAFKRGIKRDPSLFEVYKEEKQWDRWNRSVTAQARAQDASEVLNTSYVPLMADECLLFDEKLKYM